MSGTPRPSGEEAGAKGRPRATRVGRSVRGRITAGLITVLPIWLTFLLVGFVFGVMRDASLWAVEAVLASPVGRPLLGSWGVTAERLVSEGHQALPLGVRWAVSGFSVLLTVTLLYVIGAIASNFVGRQAIRAVEALVDRVPFVKTVYGALKQVLGTFAGESAHGFQRVVVFAFPNSSVRSIGFVTRSLRDSDTGEELLSVFVATVPNPTTGFVCLVKRKDVRELDWSIEDAVKAIMSGGVLLPSDVPLLPRSVGASPGNPPDSPCTPES